jgi:cobaltochelatase CobT
MSTAPHPGLQVKLRQQQRLDELCAAAIRALAGQGDLHFRGRRLFRGRQRLPLYAAHLHPSHEKDDLDSFRGAADGLALRLLRSDAALHRQHQPENSTERATERALFDLFEQLRVEALAGDEWPGARRNLRHRFEAWLLAFHHGGLTETASGLLVFTVAQITRARLTGDPVLEETEDLMEATRAGIGPAIGHALAAMRRQRLDQAAFAAPALELARWVAQQLADAAALAAEDGAEDKPFDSRIALGMRMEFEEGDVEDDAAAWVLSGPRSVRDGEDAYRVFTTAHDRELDASALVRAAQLDEFREQLDRHVQAQGVNVARLARELMALLATPLRDDWAQAQEEGFIDGRRLAQLITSPTERRLFRQPVREPVADAAVTFLIDCSGSMRTHRQAVSAMVDVFARALELAGATSEILGFTTGAWNGGRAAKDWQRAGRPTRPGRLNEVLHLVFKAAETPWRRARRDLAAMLKEDAFREGIDGEALQWAAQRLRARPERRKLLIVISDGCPMDAATGLANDPHLLDRHLQQVAGDLEAAGDVELSAVGVGLDLSPYYRRSQVIDLASSGLRHRVFAEVMGLMGRRG